MIGPISGKGTPVLYVFISNGIYSKQGAIPAGNRLPVSVFSFCVPFAFKRPVIAIIIVIRKNR